MYGLNVGSLSTSRILMTIHRGLGDEAPKRIGRIALDKNLIGRVVSNRLVRVGPHAVQLRQ